MRKNRLMSIAVATAIILALIISTGCSLNGENSQPAGEESVQSSSKDKSSITPDEGDPQSRSSRLPTPPADETALTMSIPAGVILQHSEFAISATGFEPGEEVAISAKLNGTESTSLIARITADDQGTISESTNVPVPDWLVSGIHTLVAKGERSELEIETPLYVRSDKLWIEVGDYGVRPTDKLGFVAGGFEPGETVDVFLQGLAETPLAEIVADEAGNLAWTEVDVPVVGGGEKTLLLRGASSKEEVTAVISVVPLTPWIELVPYAGRPGSQVKLHGRGFVPGETIHVTFGTNEGLTSTFTADEYGNFFDQALTTIPMDARGGSLQVQATGETSKVNISQDFSVLPLEPWVGLDVYAGPPGSTVRFRGLGFAAGERVTIHISDRNSPPVASGQTDEDGTFGWIGMTTIPIDTTRDVTFYATGESSHAQSSVVFSVIIIPTPVIPVPPQLPPPQ